MSSEDRAAPSPDRAAASPSSQQFSTPMTAASSTSSNGNPPTPRRLLNEERDEEMVPATPNEPTAGQEMQIPATPLTPLTGLEDAEDDDRSINSDSNGGSLPPGRLDEDEDDDFHDNNDTRTLARGTDVDVRVSAETFREFLRNFKSLRADASNGQEDDSSDEESDLESVVDSQPLYLEKLESLMRHTAPSSLDIDTMHLYYHNEACQRLYHQLVHYPMELVPLLDVVVQREMRRLVGDDDVPIPPVQVRPFNMKDVCNLRCLDPIAMDTLVCLKGMIVRCSPIIPDLKVAHFKCVICGDDQQVAIDRGRIREPSQCQSCNTKDSYQLTHNRCIFADKQLVRLQETPDQVPAGQTPASAVTFCFDDLVDKCQPGDKVEITGILRAQPVRVNPKVTKLKSIYKTYVDVIHFRSVTGMESSKGKEGASKITKDRIQQLHMLSQRPDIYEQLTKSLAPSIWELDNVKKGVLCMLFGGNHRRVKKGNDRSRDSDSDDEDSVIDANSKGQDEDTKLNKRGDINILLCGDPGTAKSQLLSYVHKLSSRGIYTSGKGSSAVGLTASVVRDPETRDLVLERSVRT
jgi:DNA replication licensing factor MCM4